MIRTHEFKLKPSKRQEATLREWLALGCRIFNHALEDRIRAYRDHGKTLTLFDQVAELTRWRAQVDGLRAMPVDFERDALRRVDRGMKAFFRRFMSGKKPGFPRFKSTKTYQTLEFNEERAAYVTGRHVIMPKLGPIRAYGSGPYVLGTQKILRVIQRASGWYAQIVTDDKVAPPEKHAPVSPVGIDVGLTTFATFDDGTQIKSPKWAKREGERLARLQRAVARAKKGSANRRKLVLRLRRLHEKVGNRRKDFLHQCSRQIVNRHDLIAVEDLQIQNMAQNGRFAKGIMDSAWGQFVRYLDYKAEWAGGRVVRVEPRGTSQDCSQCGTKVPKGIEVRMHRCPECGLVLDRDVNAARNILARAVGPASQNARRGHEVVAVEAGRVEGTH